MAIVTKTQIANASFDVQTIELVVNGTGEVISRLGTVLKSVRRIAADLAEIEDGSSLAAEVNTRISGLEISFKEFESLAQLVNANSEFLILNIDGFGLMVDGYLLLI